MSKNYDVLLKLLLLGDSGVGKTSLLCRYVDEEVRSTHVATIGIDFKLKTIELGGKRIRIQIWDTAGQERFETLTSQYYRRAQGILLLYDISSDKSFKNVRKWISNISEYAESNVKMVLVGNKCDIDAGRQVTAKQGQQLASEYGVKFLECSAVKNLNVTEAFRKLAEEVVVVPNENAKNRTLDRKENEAPSIYLSSQSQEEGTSENKCSC
ncbi:ras-related protein Rab-15-like [Oscarella lobularis]|uniref:ras-related protein Rab-15-like n=1 Tax=Oscarella lobularis TaxID=121494 RepID=UPI0033131E31